VSRRGRPVSRCVGSHAGTLSGCWAGSRSGVVSVIKDPKGAAVCGLGVEG
jgi:hypothetical protein